jgi:hypothetical protein
MRIDMFWSDCKILREINSHGYYDWSAGGAVEYVISRTLDEYVQLGYLTVERISRGFLFITPTYRYKITNKGIDYLIKEGEFDDVCEKIQYSEYNNNDKKKIKNKKKNKKKQILLIIF